jgi:hypothetical protein
MHRSFYLCLTRQAIAAAELLLAQDGLFIGSHLAQVLGTPSNQHFAGATRARASTVTVDLETGLLCSFDNSGSSIDLDGCASFEVHLDGSALLEDVEDTGHDPTLPANASRGHQQVEGLPSHV